MKSQCFEIEYHIKCILAIQLCNETNSFLRIHGSLKANLWALNLGFREWIMRIVNRIAIIIIGALSRNHPRHFFKKNIDKTNCYEHGNESECHKSIASMLRLCSRQNLGFEWSDYRILEPASDRGNTADNTDTQLLRMNPDPPTKSGLASVVRLFLAVPDYCSSS